MDIEFRIDPETCKAKKNGGIGNPLLKDGYGFTCFKEWNYPFIPRVGEVVWVDKLLGIKIHPDHAPQYVQDVDYRANDLGELIVGITLCIEKGYEDN